MKSILLVAMILFLFIQVRAAETCFTSEDDYKNFKKDKNDLPEILKTTPLYFTVENATVKFGPLNFSVTGVGSFEFVNGVPYYYINTNKSVKRPVQQKVIFCIDGMKVTFKFAKGAPEIIEVLSATEVRAREKLNLTKSDKVKFDRVLQSLESTKADQSGPSTSSVREAN